MSLDHIDTAIGFVVVILLLSLVVTTIVQMVVWTFNLRGINLAQGITRLLQQVPGLDRKASDLLTQRVLHHPALTTFKQRKVTTIRKEELLQLLPMVAAQLDQSTKIAAPTKALLRSALREDWLLSANQAVEQFANVNPAAAKVLQERLAKIKPTSGALLESVETWFDSIMDRTSEVFTLWTRSITTVAALVLAFAFHIDSLELIKEISSNRELRAKLVNGAGYKPAAGQPALPVMEFPTDLKTREQGEAWLRKELGKSSALGAVLRSYHEDLDTQAKAEIDRLRKDASDLVDHVTKTNLVVMDFKQRPPFVNYWGKWPHLWGTLMTGVFLSLGAPFWHTMLRNVVALRPALAGKIEKETSASRESGA